MIKKEVDEFRRASVAFYAHTTYDLYHIKDTLRQIQQTGVRMQEQVDAISNSIQQLDYVKRNLPPLPGEHAGASTVKKLFALLAAFGLGGGAAEWLRIKPTHAPLIVK